MLFVVVILSAVFYVALLIGWNIFQPQMESSALALAGWRDVIFKVPDPGVLIVLKEVIIMAVVYLIFDFVHSYVRRLRRRNAPPPTSWRTHKLPDYSEPL